MRPAPLTDGILYISQARTLQPEGERRPYFEMGYSTFLSYFEFSALTDGSKGTADPALTKVYRAQSIILSASIVILLVSAFMILRGPLVLRAAAAIALGGLMLSPLVAVWPNQILTESLAVPAVVLLVAACIATDARPGALVFVAACCGLMIWSRDSMIYFICLFLGLLAPSIWRSARFQSPRFWFGSLLVVLTLAGTIWCATLLPARDLCGRVLANVIQIRMLPDQEAKEYFARRGLPLTEVVLARAGYPGWVDNKWFMSDSDLQDEPETSFTTAIGCSPTGCEPT
jgi:hypothetical protein